MNREFKFKSKFSIFIRKTFIEHKMFLKMVAKEIGCNIVVISYYYNDQKILTLEHAQAFSDLLKSLNINYSADELMQMQKQAEFIICDNRSVAEVLGLELSNEP